MVFWDWRKDTVIEGKFFSANSGRIIDLLDFARTRQHTPHTQCLSVGKLSYRRTPPRKKPEPKYDVDTPDNN